MCVLSLSFQVLRTIVLYYNISWRVFSKEHSIIEKSESKMTHNRYFIILEFLTCSRIGKASDLDIHVCADKIPDVTIYNPSENFIVNSVERQFTVDYPDSVFNA